MDRYITAATIRQLRKRSGLTQADVAERLHVSDKTVSKWETGKGYPDITLLEPIAEVFGVSVTELLSGNTVSNKNVSANMMRSGFYICPVCGNIIYSIGEAVIACHGIQLLKEDAEETDDSHRITVRKIEEEYYVRIEHDMTREHYISFIAAVSADRLQLVKLYPEMDAEARFMIPAVKRIYAFCKRDGMFYLDVDPSALSLSENAL